MPDEIYGVMAVKNGQKQTIMNLSNARQKSYADLQTMTDAQKKGVIVCPDYPKEEFLVTADEVSYGSGTVKDALDKAGKYTKLWENADPSATFINQRITLASGDYDLLLIIAYLIKTSHSSLSVMAKKGDDAYITFCDLNSSGVAIGSYRNFSYYSDTQIDVSHAYLGGNSRIIDDERLIPVVVYGIKL